MKSPTIALALCTLALAVTAPAQNLLTNGSFEQPGFSGFYLDLTSGSTYLSGWTVGPTGGIDVLNLYWPASDGADSIDLHGLTGPGSIKQSVWLTNGTSYRL